MYALNRDTHLELSARIDALDQKFNGLSVAVWWLDGAVYDGLPERRRAVPDETRSTEHSYSG